MLPSRLLIRPRIPGLADPTSYLTCFETNAIGYNDNYFFHVFHDSVCSADFFTFQGSHRISELRHRPALFVCAAYSLIKLVCYYLSHRK